MQYQRVCVLPADIPLKKAVAGVRVGLLPEVGFVVNPTVQQMEESTLDLIMAGTDSAVLMIEGYCDFLTEAQMLEVFQISTPPLPRGPSTLFSLCVLDVAATRSYIATFICQTFHT